MKRRRPRSLVFDHKRLLELSSGTGRNQVVYRTTRHGKLVDVLIPQDALTRAMANLAAIYGPEAFDRAHLIEEYIWVEDADPKRPRRGPKLKWGDEGNYHAWLSIENLLRKARKTNPNIRVTKVLQEKFRQLRGKPWCVLRDETGAGEHLCLRSWQQARNRYVACRRFLKRNPIKARQAEAAFEMLGKLAQKLPLKLA
jgi:hypothetical protein